jgi:hypothetical protein
MHQGRKASSGTSGYVPGSPPCDRWPQITCQTPAISTVSRIPQPPFMPSAALYVVKFTFAGEIRFPSPSPCFQVLAREKSRRNGLTLAATGMSTRTMFPQGRAPGHLKAARPGNRMLLNRPLTATPGSAIARKCQVNLAIVEEFLHSRRVGESAPAPGTSRLRLYTDRKIPNVSWGRRLATACFFLGDGIYSPLSI